MEKLPCKIAHLGPTGTYAETAAMAFQRWLNQAGQTSFLCPFPSIVQTIRSVAAGEVTYAVVPVENSIEGSVTTTMDALWQCDGIQIHHEIVLPIHHALVSYVGALTDIQTVYGHPQALAQCQLWLEAHVPAAQIIAKNSSTESLPFLASDRTAAAITPDHAAQLYELPILHSPINDYPDNCTRFWVLSQTVGAGGPYTSIAFSLPQNVPGALLQPLTVFAQRAINMSRIESRPTKRSLGEYVFFVDLEADTHDETIQTTLDELGQYTEVLKILGRYSILPSEERALADSELGKKSRN